VPTQSPLRPEAIADAMASVASMTLTEKEHLADEMYQKQPHVLGTAIVASRMSSRGEVQDAAIEIAMAVFLCFQEHLSAHGEISEIEIDQLAERNTRMWKFLDSEPAEAFTRSVKLTLDSYPEPGLLGYVASRLNELVVEEPQYILAMKTLLDACVEAKWPGLAANVMNEEDR